MSASALQSSSRSAGEVREIPLTKGLVAIVDAADFDLVSGHVWRAITSASRRTHYALTDIVADGVEVTLSMHRLIMGAKPGEEIDHRDGDGLNNRRVTNLRPCSHAQNARNRRTPQNNKLGLKGVVNDRGRYRAVIMVDGRQVNIGAFNCPLKAARAYDLAAIKHFGEFARLNFDPSRDWLFPHEEARGFAAGAQGAVAAADVQTD